MVCLFISKTCNKQYVRSCITSFCVGFNNYYCQHRIFHHFSTIKRVSFLAHFKENVYHGFEDCEIILMDRGPYTVHTRKENFSGKIN